MNKRQRKVFTLLKTKCKAFGFNRKELEGLALGIDKNLQLEENASDEDVDAAIESAVDAAIPFLQVSQSAAQRSTQKAIQNFKDRYDIQDDDDEEEDEEGTLEEEGNQKPNHQRANRNKKQKNQGNNGNDELLNVIKTLSDEVKGLKGQITTLQGDRVKDTRRSKLKKLVENTGKFGKRVMKEFDALTFEDEDAFENYLEEVENDLEEMNQERADAGLDKLGVVPSPTKTNREKPKTEVLSDDEIISLAGGQPKPKQN